MQIIFIIVIFEIPFIIQYINIDIILFHYSITTNRQNYIQSKIHEFFFHVYMIFIYQNPKFFGYHYQEFSQKYFGPDELLIYGHSHSEYLGLSTTL